MGAPRLRRRRHRPIELGPTACRGFDPRRAGLALLRHGWRRDAGRDRLAQANQGHGRHLLASLGSKLAILGPPRIVAEVPETLVPACELFSASGHVREAVLTDYVLQREENDAREVVGMSDDRDGRFVIPVTIDDLSANGLLGEADPQVCWERSVETLTARKSDIAGLAVASDERIEAYLLHVTRGTEETEIVSLRSFIEDGGAHLKQLLAQLRARGVGAIRFPKVHPAEISRERLETLGFSPAGASTLRGAGAVRLGS